MVWCILSANFTVGSGYTGIPIGTRMAAQAEILKKAEKGDHDKEKLQV